MLKRGSLKYFFHFLIESLYLLFFKKKQETKNKHGNSKNLGGRSLMILPPNDTTVSICGFDFFSVCSFFFFFFSLSQYQIICNPFLKVMFINHEGGEGKTVLPGRICKICGLSALRVSVTVLIFQFTPLFLCSVHRTSLSDLWSSMGACWVYIPPPAQIQHV